MFLPAEISLEGMHNCLRTDNDSVLSDQQSVQRHSQNNARINRNDRIFFKDVATSPCFKRLPAKSTFILWQICKLFMYIEVFKKNFIFKETLGVWTKRRFCCRRVGHQRQWRCHLTILHALYQIIPEMDPILALLFQAPRRLFHLVAKLFKNKIAILTFLYFQHLIIV